MTGLSKVVTGCDDGARIFGSPWKRRLTTWRNMHRRCDVKGAFGVSDCY
jgi:hypothetical protein